MKSAPTSRAGSVLLSVAALAALGACSGGRGGAPCAPSARSAPSAPYLYPPPSPAMAAPGSMACGAGKCGGGGVVGIPGVQDVERPHNTESYASEQENPFVRVADEALSTFSIDVDTASYANVRRLLADGQRPPPGAVRIEELLNYFPYAYEGPSDGNPFAVRIEGASCPWAPEHRLVRIGLKGREIPKSDRPAGNFVFLLDVSGSMDHPKKLPLVRESMKLMLADLSARDTVAIAVYAGASGLVLPPTSVEKRAEIAAAIDALEPGGSTNGAEGIELAYQQARAGFVRGGINRVVLCTDGDFNVGITDESQLVRLIERKAKEGVFLTVLGFGMGNLKDSTLEKLADKGNGNYGYVDSELEARKLLVEQAGGTLVTIAKDVKIQVEFNPAQVEAYRLIGYENRILSKQDFNDDAKDAGEIGAGHTVTALYEVVPAGRAVPGPGVDPLKYQKPGGTSDAASSGELLTVKLRYKDPDGDASRLLAFPFTDYGASIEKASEDFRFAASVAGFGMVLGESKHKGQATYESVASMAREAMGQDAGGYRRGFLDLVEKARALSSKPQ